jgi:hypothetical protein
LRAQRPGAPTDMAPVMGQVVILLLNVIVFDLGMAIELFDMDTGESFQHKLNLKS